MEGVLADSVFSQQEEIEASNSGTKYQRGVRKKKDRTRGKGRSVFFKESTLNVKVYIWWKSYGLDISIDFFSVSFGRRQREAGEEVKVDNFASECIRSQNKDCLSLGIVTIT